MPKVLEFNKHMFFNNVSGVNIVYYFIKYV